MAIDIMLTVAFTAVIQSIFGAGVLLFGTPLLLLLGYSFIDVLMILLPISLIINGLQIAKDKQHIDMGFYKKIVVLTLPAIAVCLFMITHIRFNIGLLIGAFVLLIALRPFSSALTVGIDRLMAHETLYFLIMGVIHGVSNLGGSLLTAAVHHKAYAKDIARVTVASSYATFAITQLVTLAVFNQNQANVSFYDNAIYAAVGALVFAMVDSSLYLKLDQQKYQTLFSMFLAISGLLLIGKAL